jgi:hypothetical protein
MKVGCSSAASCAYRIAGCCAYDSLCQHQLHLGRPALPSIPLVYIIGPFTGPTNWAIQQNVQAAERVMFDVVQAGAMPQCPHTNSRNFHGVGTPEFWYGGTRVWLAVCHAAVVMPNWELSKGSCDEVKDAQGRGQPLFYFDQDREKFQQWVIRYKEDK